MKPLLLAVLLLYTTSMSFAQIRGVGANFPVGKIHCDDIPEISKLVMDAPSLQTRNQSPFLLRNTTGTRVMHFHTPENANVYTGIIADKKVRAHETSITPQGEAIQCPDVFFEDVGDLPGDCISSLPTDISSDGKRVVLSSSADDPDIPDDGGTCDPYVGWPHSNQAAGWTRPCEGKSFFNGQHMTGLIGLGYLEGDQPHSESLASGISPDGKIVVGYSNTEPDNNTTAAVFFKHGPEPLAVYDSGCIARDVCLGNAIKIVGGFTDSRMRGRIVVGFSNILNQYANRSPGAQAVYWDNWNRVNVLPLPEALPNDSMVISAEAVCISDDGEFIGGNLYYNKKMSPQHYMSFPCIWRFNRHNPSGQSYDLLCVLEDLPGGDDNALIRSISGNGKVIVGYGSQISGDPACWDYFTVACRWEIVSNGNNAGCTGPFALMGLEGYPGSAANGVNSNGSVIVGGCHLVTGPCSSPEFMVRPVRWNDPDDVPEDIGILMEDYIPEGWMLFDAIRVSANGKIVIGYGIDYDYNVVGWVAGLPQGEQQMQSRTTGDPIEGILITDNSIIEKSETAYIAYNKDEELFLDQNNPNPCDDETIIRFHIPESMTHARIMITEAITGKVVMEVPVSFTDTEIEIETARLLSGCYLYSLFVDGKVIATRRLAVVR
jgi:uncharacterized membrane protein